MADQQEPSSEFFDEIRKDQAAKNEAGKMRNIDEGFGRKDTDPFNAARQRHERASRPDRTIDDAFGVS